jgi:hypothetical protein
MCSHHKVINTKEQVLFEVALFWILVAILSILFYFRIQSVGYSTFEHK